MSVNFSHYNTFLCVAESGSISLAARKLGVTQPAVSAEISALEGALDTALFHRSSRGVTLTEAGKTLYEHAKRGISCLRIGENRLRELKTLEYGSLRVGVSRDVLTALLFDEVSTFTERFPCISVSFFFESKDSLTHMLKSGELDIAIISEPVVRQETEGLTVTRFSELQDILVAHPTLPICRESRVTRRRLAEYSLILDAEDSSQARFLRSYLPQSAKATVHCDSGELAIRLAEMGIGVSAVLEGIAENAIRDGRVQRVDIADRLPPRALYVAVPEDVTPAAAALRDIILELSSRSE